jgi:hypothetical protein
VPSGTSGAASTPNTRGGDLRDSQAVWEYGRCASFLVVRDVRRRTKPAQAPSVSSRFETPELLVSRTCLPPILPLKSQVLDTSAQAAHGPRTCTRDGGRPARPGTARKLLQVELRLTIRHIFCLGAAATQPASRNCRGGSGPRSAGFARDWSPRPRSAGSRVTGRRPQLIAFGEGLLLAENAFGFLR